MRAVTSQRSCSPSPLRGSVEPYCRPPARLRRAHALRHSSGLFAVVTSLFVVTAVGASGCDCSDDPSNPTGPGGPGGPGSGGAGGAGGSGGIGNGELTEATVVTEVPSPFDAALSADASLIYFTASGADGAGVYSVPVGGGDPLPLLVGDPLVAPFSLVVSSDGKSLYVADLAVEGSADDEKDGGKIYKLGIEGGAPTEVLSTELTHPRGLALLEEGESDVLYYSGRTADGTPAVFRVAAEGGRPTAIFSGAPLVDPSGVAASADAVYVIDTQASSRGLASIIKIAGGEAEEILAHLPVGYPAGIAFSEDGSALLVSGFDESRDQSAVLRIDLVSEEVEVFPPADSSVFDGLGEPGGLHRAKDADVYTFVESASEGGKIFVVR
jgi:DNA-binding beta-propeller fold protein YncE